MINLIFIFLIKAIRPLLGYIGHCRYEVSCYDYGLHKLENDPLINAIYDITKRVICCNPFYRK